MASTTYKNIKIPYPTEAVIRTAAIDDTVAPEDSAQLFVNMNADRVGAIQTRLGIAQIVDLENPIISFGSFNTDAPLNRLLAQAGASGVSVYSVDTVLNTSSVVRTITANTKGRYAQYLNLTWMVNGTNGDAVQTFNGTAFGTTMVPASFPKGDFINAGFEGRVWVVQKPTGTVYFTDIVEFTPPSTFVLTFDPTINFIKNISPQDGETSTALFEVPRSLLLFKQNKIFRIYGAYSVDSYPAYNVGTYSAESIVRTKDGIYFHHSSGFYKFDYGGQPVEISRRIIDFVQNISRTYYESICGVWDGYDSIEWSVGSVTVEGVTFENCVCRYTISTQVWTIYDYTGPNATNANNRLSAMIRYDNGVTFVPHAGNRAGKIGVLGSGFTDFTTPFYYEYIDRWRSFTEMYSHAKSLSGINVYSENAAGANLMYQVQKETTDTWHILGTVDEKNNSLMPNAQSETDFDVMRLRLAGTTNGTQVVVHGIEILSIQDKGYNIN